MVTSSPYLPDIMQGVVARVNTTFSTRADNPFPVFFDKGIYGQVSRQVYDRPDTNFPLIWLVMPFTESVGKDPTIWANITCHLIIGMPTDNTYTQQQRDDVIYKPKLLPVYDELMVQISRERWFSFAGPRRIEHKRIIQPYWGGGDVNGADTDNLWKQKIDAIAITGLQLQVKMTDGRNCTF